MKILSKVIISAVFVFFCIDAHAMLILRRASKRGRSWSSIVEQGAVIIETQKLATGILGEPLDRIPDNKFHKLMSQVENGELNSIIIDVESDLFHYFVQWLESGKTKSIPDEQKIRLVQLANFILPNLEQENQHIARNNGDIHSQNKLNNWLLPALGAIIGSALFYSSTLSGAEFQNEQATNPEPSMPDANSVAQGTSDASTSSYSRPSIIAGTVLATGTFLGAVYFLFYRD